MNDLLEAQRQRRVTRGLQSTTVPYHLAASLIGQTVALLNRSHSISHGVVAGVIHETGRPKLIVNRHEYDLNQVLSVTPPVCN
jgi:hypothetical protein